jgi:hypothetical protein
VTARAAGAFFFETVAGLRAAAFFGTVTALRAAAFFFGRVTALRAAAFFRAGPCPRGAGLVVFPRAGLADLVAFRETLDFLDFFSALGRPADFFLGDGRAPRPAFFPFAAGIVTPNI